jgi:hypothetical protein
MSCESVVKRLFRPASLLLLVAAPAAAQPVPRDSTPTLGLEQGVVNLSSGTFALDLVRASQTAAALRPGEAPTYDFTPSDWLQRRAANNYYHLGDLNVRVRAAGSLEWKDYSTAAGRKPVEALAASGAVLAAADLAATLPSDIPLRVRRYWEQRDGKLALRFEVQNRTSQPVEIGGLGIPLVFNNILAGRSLDEAHAVASFHDPYIGGDAGYLQVVPLSGVGSVLLVLPLEGTPFEAYRPLLDDPTRRGVTFEGFYEWMAHSRGWAENEWRDAEQWNAATSVTLAPGETRSYGLAFVTAPSLRGIEATLREHDRPVAVGVPGYVVPTDIEAKLFLSPGREVRSIEVEPAGALTFSPARTTPEGWRAYDVRGVRWGRARVTVTYADGLRQTMQYKVIKPATQVVADMGNFMFTHQWFDRPDDPFNRSPSIITYDYEERKQVTEDNRAWIAGLSDEGGAGAWLTAVMKQLIQPDPEEVRKLERFVDGVLWGGIQYADGERRFGIRKSLFFYEPDLMPAGTYSEDVRYGGWSSWSKQEAESVGRSYNYTHPAAAYWVLYRLARNNRSLVTNHQWDWYLERAYETGQAMVRLAPHYAQYGQMEGTVFLLILQDLKREGWTEQAAALEETMRKRAEVWRALGYPFGSEMPWDSTGQEEVHAWTRYFGFDEKAAVTLNAILAYMPTVPHWAYNGSARRYWDFVYAGKLRRIERQLHHYGSGLNAIPVLVEYRDAPEDLYLLRVGYGGVLGSISNVTEDGFLPAAFHSYPSTLEIDGITGDNGPNFFGHVVNTGAYLVRHRDFGWLGFGGNVRVEGTGANQTVRLEPRDASRSRVYLAPLGLWLTLDAGSIESVTLSGQDVVLRLAAATASTPRALLNVEQPARITGVGAMAPVGTFTQERGSYVVPLGQAVTEVRLRAAR